MRHILNIPAASVILFLLANPSYAQTDAYAPAAAPSPSGTGATSATMVGSVHIHQVTIDSKATDVMQLGSGKEDQPGVRFVTGAIHPAPGFAGGKLFWLETCVPDQWRQDNAGKWSHLTSDGPCVNRNAPTSIGPHGDAIESPMVILDPNYQVQTVHDQYTTYLMFQSDLPKSIPIPLVSFSWSWTGVGTRNGTKWNLTKPGTSGNPRRDAHPALPTWTATLDSLSYKPSEKGPPADN